MNEKEFFPEQFSRRPGVAQIDTELRKWLRSRPVTERLKFIKTLFSHNYRYALSLVRSSQLPTEEVVLLLKSWLLLGKHNCSNGLTQGLVPVIGERRFWTTAAQLELTQMMSEFLNYYSHGKLQQYIDENKTRY